MPLRDDLLQPISEDAPAGADLSYDKLFDQIKEARTEDDDSLPTGNWSRPVKRADRALVVQLAGEALATRSKDLRLAGWYGEALLRREGFTQLTPILQLMQQVQDQFWDGLYPSRDDDGDPGRRIGALEGVATQLAVQLRSLPITGTGISFSQALDARALGYERDATTQAKKDLRADAVKRGRVVAEDLDRAIADTPKAFYSETDVALRGAVVALEALDAFHEERYGDDPPSFLRLKSALGEVQPFAAGILAEKRKLEPDPDPLPAAAEPQATAAEPSGKAEETVAASPVHPAAEPDLAGAQIAEQNMAFPGPVANTASANRPLAEPDSRGAALGHLAAAVRFFSRGEASLDTAYLLAAAPGVTLVLRTEPDVGWPAPGTGVRQPLRQLARSKNWAALERAALETFAAQPEMVWLDLHRYLWLAAAELGHHALAGAVMATVSGWLQHRPALEKALLDDDTPMASTETQHWLAALQPELPGEITPVAGHTARELSAAVAAVLTRGAGNSPQPGHAGTDPSGKALSLLQEGRSAEAIGLLSRYAEEQPSGRMRFERRLETAELCLQAGHAAVAQPLLADLTAELERRTLEGWEAASLLGKPLALTIRCLDQGVSSPESRGALFARLCRLDPMAAAALDRREAGGTG